MKYNFTLIIPTHNRHNYLKRSISYFKDLKVTVIYCDSSEKGYTGYLEENMVYLHLPGKKFAEKILIALENVRTNYVALCADDDFILKESLYKGCEFLKENSEYQTIVGKCIAFHDKFDGVFYWSYQKFPQDLNFDSKTNAKMFFRNYYQILWAMYNKNILLESFNIIKKANFSNDNFIELTLGTVACNFGGIKFLNNIWCVRELSTMEHWGNRHKGIANIFFDKNIKNDFKLFKSYIDKISYNGCADLVLKSYLKLSFIKKYKMIFIAILKKIIPKKLISLIKFYYKKQEPDSNLKNKYINLQTVVLSSEELLKLENVKAILYKNV